MSGKKIEVVLGDVASAYHKSEQADLALDTLNTRTAAKEPFLGWYKLPEETDALKQVQAWLKKVPKNQNTLCVLGIGGSCLGAKAVYDFLEPKKAVLFFDNIDGYSFERRLSRLDFKKTHFLAISKSGETSETLFQVAHILNIFNQKKLKAKQYLSVITEDKPSSLKNLADSLSLNFMTVPFDVGGRFSVFSTVGLAPLAWSGINIKDLLKGAREVQNQKETVSTLIDFYAKSLEASEWISIFWIYVDGLKTFGLWLEQLWAESLAKKFTRDGRTAPRSSTPFSCIGATDQHSLLQQFTEGARDKSFLLIKCIESGKSKKIPAKTATGLSLASARSVGELLNIESLAAQKVLDKLGRRTACLTIENHSAHNIGALLFMFQLLVAGLGEILGVNAFDQPGVEEIKKITLGSLGDPRYKDHALP